MSEFWIIRFHVPEPAVAAFLEVLEPSAMAVSAFEGPGRVWTVEALAERTPAVPMLSEALGYAAAAAGIAVPEVTCLPLSDRDWLTENRRSFAPIRAGRYFIHPTVWDGPVPVSGIGICLDAATAFGSGAHGSTRGCLLALDWLARRERPGRVLDLGCGSGILAIAAARTWRCPVLAVDLDPEAVRVSRFNARCNGVNTLMLARLGDSVRQRRIAAEGPFDLVIANILARPLIAMARDLSGGLAPGAALILSGLTENQENGILAAYARLGQRLRRRFVVDGWATLMLSR